MIISLKEISAKSSSFQKITGMGGVICQHFNKSSRYFGPLNVQSYGLRTMVASKGYIQP